MGAQNLIINPDRRPIYHTLDDDGCAGIAFYSCAKGGEFGLLPSSNVNDIQMPDGTKPPIGKPLRCGACGEIWSKTIKQSIMLVVSEAQTKEYIQKVLDQETSNTHA